LLVVESVTVIGVLVAENLWSMQTRRAVKVSMMVTRSFSRSTQTLPLRFFDTSTVAKPLASVVPVNSATPW
jgi:hypothetical protein